MGLIRQALDTALGTNQVSNGFNGARWPVGNSSSAARAPHYPARQSQQWTESDESQFRESRTPRNPSYLTPPPLPARSPRVRDRELADVPRSWSSDSKQSDDKQYDIPEERQVYEDRPPAYSLSPPQAANDYESSRYQEAPIEAPRSFRLTESRQSQSTPGFHVFALPQTAHSESAPFLRAYSAELDRSDISMDTFIDILDRINVAIIPNPENQIIQKGARIAGAFAPGFASVGLLAGRVAVGVGSAYGHQSAIAKVLSKANLEIFLPRNLEICIGRTQDLNNEVGYAPNQTSQPMTSVNEPEERIAVYGDLLAPVTHVLQQTERRGRGDPIAVVGKFLGDRDDDRKTRRAYRRMDRGRTKRVEELEGDLKWLMIRKATSNALGHWQKLLQQNRDAEAQQHDEVQGERL